MKLKHGLILLLIGYCFEFIGTFEKIMHYSYSDLVWIFSLTFKLAGAILVAYKIQNNPKLKDFWNS